MADCPDANTLAGYLDGTLSEKERARIEAHLADCPECAAAVDELRDLLVPAASDAPSAPAAVKARAKALVKKS